MSLRVGYKSPPRLTRKRNFHLFVSFVFLGVAKDVAQNMAAFFQKVFMDQATVFDQQPTDHTSTADGERPSMSPVDLAGELVSDASTCKELGYQAFDFFKVNRVNMREKHVILPIAALGLRSAETCR